MYRKIGSGKQGNAFMGVPGSGWTYEGPESEDIPQHCASHEAVRHLEDGADYLKEVNRALKATQTQLEETKEQRKVEAQQSAMASARTGDSSAIGVAPPEPERVTLINSLTDQVEQLKVSQEAARKELATRAEAATEALKADTAYRQHLAERLAEVEAIRAEKAAALAETDGQIIEIASFALASEPAKQDRPSKRNHDSMAKTNSAVRNAGLQRIRDSFELYQHPATKQHGHGMNPNVAEGKLKDRLVEYGWHRDCADAELNHNTPCPDCSAIELGASFWY